MWEDGYHYRYHGDEQVNRIPDVGADNIFPRAFSTSITAV